MAAIPWARRLRPRDCGGPGNGGGPLAQETGAIPWRAPLAQGTGGQGMAAIPWGSGPLTHPLGQGMAVRCGQGMDPILWGSGPLTHPPGQRMEPIPWGSRIHPRRQGMGPSRVITCAATWCCSMDQCCKRRCNIANHLILS